MLDWTVKISDETTMETPTIPWTTSLDMGNLTDLGFSPQLPVTPLASTVLIVMEVILGTFTNGTLIYLVASVCELRTSPNLLLANLALGDFIFIMITAPPVISPSYITMSFQYCRINHFIYYTSFGVSSLSLMAISIERYFAIVKPFLMRRVPIMRATAFICVVIWLISSSIASYVFPTAIKTPGVDTTCTFEYETLSYQRFYLVQLVVFYFLPSLSMTTFYALCAKKLLRKKAILHRRRSGNTDDRARLRVSVNLFIITFIFIICWLPNYVYMTWFLFAFDFAVIGTKWWYYFKYVRIVFYYFASCINPIVLYSMSSSFRQHLARKFGLHRKRRATCNMSDRTRSSMIVRDRSSVIVRTSSVRSIPQFNLPNGENSNNVDNHYVRTASDSV